MNNAKLVRDKIPDIIRASGETPITHVATTQEYVRLLHQKLQEEVNEFLDSENTEELADILEVIVSLANETVGGIKKLDEIRMEKREQRGGFDGKIILDEIKKS